MSEPQLSQTSQEVPSKPTDSPPRKSGFNPKDYESLTSSKCRDHLSSTPHNASIELGNFTITLKKDPLEGIDPRILETASTNPETSKKNDNLSYKKTSDWNKRLNPSTNPFEPSVVSKKVPKFNSEVQSFHPSGKIINNILPDSWHEARPNKHQYPQKKSNYTRRCEPKLRDLRNDPDYERKIDNKQRSGSYYSSNNPYQVLRECEPKRSFKKYQQTPVYPQYFTNERVRPIGPPPSKPQSAYLMFVNDKYFELKQLYPHINNDSALKRANEIWLYELSSLDKEAYEHKFAEFCKEHYKKYETYKPSHRFIPEYSSRQRTNQRIRPDSSPQNVKVKFRTAYKFFKLDHIAEVKEKHPNTGFKERSEVLKAMWKSLPPKSKYLYVQRSRLDKKNAVLAKKMEEIKETQTENDPSIKQKSLKSEPLQEKHEFKKEEGKILADSLFDNSGDENDEDYIPSEDKSGTSIEDEFTENESGDQSDDKEATI